MEFPLAGGEGKGDDAPVVVEVISWRGQEDV